MRYAYAVLFMLWLAVMAAGCGPHQPKHYRTKGQVQHYPNCRPKCAAKTARDWHERRMP